MKSRALRLNRMSGSTRRLLEDILAGRRRRKRRRQFDRYELKTLKNHPTKSPGAVTPRANKTTDDRINP